MTDRSQDPGVPPDPDDPSARGDREPAPRADGFDAEEELAEMLALLGHDGAAMPTSWSTAAGEVRWGVELGGGRLVRPDDGPGSRRWSASDGLGMCGRTGSYRGVAHCWFASDGRVYGPGGTALGSW